MGRETMEIIDTLNDDSGKGRSVETKVRVNISVQRLNQFILVKNDLLVNEKTASSYGYPTNLPGRVSVFDVLVKIHERLYFDDFTRQAKNDYLSLAASGWITKMFGFATSQIGFSINNTIANAGILGYNDHYVSYKAIGSEVKDNDFISLFFYQDNLYSDKLCWFEHKYEELKQATIEQGEVLNARLVGYPYMYYSTRTNPISYAKPLSGLGLGIVAKDSGIIRPLKVETDEEGRFKLSVSKPGKYVVSAYPNSQNRYIISPILKLTVV
jgi:hypothetical protein